MKIINILVTEALYKCIWKLDKVMAPDGQNL